MTTVPIITTDVYLLYFEQPTFSGVMECMDFRPLESDPLRCTMRPKFYTRLKENLKVLTELIKMKPIIQDGRVLFLEMIAANILQSTDYSDQQMTSFFLHGNIVVDATTVPSRKRFDEEWCQGMRISSHVFQLNPAACDYLDTMISRMGTHPSRMFVTKTSHNHILDDLAGIYDILFMASIMRNPFVQSLGPYMWPLFRSLAIPVPLDSSSLEYLLFTARLSQLVLRLHPLNYEVKPSGRKVKCLFLVLIGDASGNGKTSITLDNTLAFENALRVRFISIHFRLSPTLAAPPIPLVDIHGADRWMGHFELNDVVFSGGGIFADSVNRLVFDRCRILDAAVGVRAHNVIDVLFLNSSNLPVGEWNFHNCLHGIVLSQVGGLRIRLQCANYVGKYLALLQCACCEITGLKLTDVGSFGTVSDGCIVSLNGYEVYAKYPCIQAHTVHESMGIRTSVSIYPAEKIPVGQDPFFDNKPPLVNTDTIAEQLALESWDYEAVLSPSF